MIKAYIYCSYKGSPVGFKLGSIIYDAARQDDYIPVSDGISPFIRCAFEQGFVRRMYGRIPEPGEGRYVLLAKKLEYAPSGGNKAKLYMNFCFEFDDFDDFQRFSNNFLAMEDGDRAEKSASFILPDSAVQEFALKIRAREFNAFISELLGENNAGLAAIDGKCGEYIYFGVQSSKDDAKKLSDAFRLDVGKFFMDAEKTYCYPKSSTDNPGKKKVLPLILGAAVVMAILIYLLSSTH